MFRATQSGGGKVRRGHVVGGIGGSGGGGGGGTWDAWDPATATASRFTFSNSDHTITRAAVGDGFASGARTLDITPKASGKWYREFVCTWGGPSADKVGLANIAVAVNVQLGEATTSIGIARTGLLRYNAGWSSVDVGTFTAGQIAGLAIDVATGNVWLSRNGTWVGDPAAGTDAWFTGIDFTQMITKVYSENAGNQWTIPQTSTYAVPSGFSIWGSES
jgi:hypothetical protein